MRSKSLWVLSVLLVLSLVLGACQQAAPAEPETIIETVVVEVAGTPVVEERIITATPAPMEPEPEAATGPLAADSMVACLPIPELPEAAGFTAAAGPSIVSDVPKVEQPSFFDAQVGLQQAGAVYRVGVFEDVTTTNFWAANGPDNTVWNSYMLPESAFTVWPDG